MLKGSPARAQVEKYIRAAVQKLSVTAFKESVRDGLNDYRRLVRRPDTSASEDRKTSEC